MILPQHCVVYLLAPVVVIVLHFGRRSCLRLAHQTLDLHQDRRDFGDHFADFLVESITRSVEPIKKFL